MKTDSADPRSVLEGNEGFSPEALERARAAANDPAHARAEDVAALPEPLAAAVLDAAARAGAVGLVDALTSSPNKALAKAAKKALYVLKSKGVAVPEKKAPEPKPAPPAAVEEPLPSLVSAITGTGERALIIGRPVRGRVETLQVVIADEHGLVHLGINEISRGQYRKLLKDAERPDAPSAVQLPLESAKELLGEAAGTNLRTKTPFPQDMDTALRHLGVSPWTAPREVRDPEDGDQAAAVGGASLHDLKEFAQWLPPVEALQSFALKAEEIATSALYIDEKQRAEQLRKALSAAAEELVKSDAGKIYGRRMWLMGEFLERAGQADAARTARAEARRIFHAAEGMLSPFVVRMFEKVLALRGSAGGPPPASQDAGPEARSPGGLILP